MNTKKKINVLFVIFSFGTGGSERIVLDLCKGLNRDLFKPFVISFYNNIGSNDFFRIQHGSELIEEFNKIKVWNFCLNKRGGVDFKLMKSLSKLISEKNIDVINAHHFSQFFHTCPGAFLNNTSLIYTEHTMHEIRLLPFYWVMIGRFLLKRCYAVIGISKGCTRQLMETFHVPAHKSFTVLNAIDNIRFESSINVEAKRRDIQISKNEKVIGVVGNLREQKNHANLIKAFKIIKQKVDNIRLLIVGEGPMGEQLRDLSRKLEIEPFVHFLGARLDIAELYKIMDVYCLSSHYEGLPLTILEAMSSKLPVVGTNVVGINDVIIHAQNGILVDPDNPMKLAEAIIYSLENEPEARKLSENGHLYVQEHHQMTSWIKTYETLFSSASQRSSERRNYSVSHH